MTINGLATLAIWAGLITLLGQWRLQRIQVLLRERTAAFDWMQALGAVTVINLAAWTAIYSGAAGPVRLWQLSVLAVGTMQMISIEVVSGLINYRIRPSIRIGLWVLTLAGVLATDLLGLDGVVERHLPLFGAHYDVPQVKLWVLGGSAVAAPLLVVLALAVMRAFPGQTRAYGIAFGATAMAAGFLLDHVIARQHISSPYLTSWGAWTWTISLLWIGEAVATKRLNERVGRRQRETARTTARSAFLANMSHELRTPLAGVIGLTEIVIADAAPDSEQGRLAKALRRSSLVLNHLVGEVLELESIAQDKATLSMKRFTSAQLLEDFRARLLPIVDEPTRIEFDGDEMDIVPIGDVARIRRAFVDMARFAFNNCSGRVVAQCRAEAIDDANCTLRLCVSGSNWRPGSDEGSGGTALTFTKSLAEYLGASFQTSVDGDVWVGELVLQLAAAGVAGAPTPADGTETALRLDGFRLLVVDDHSVNRMLMATPLRLIGAEVVEVDGGQAALDALRTDTFDLMLLDLHMPGMDGFETARNLRRMEAEGSVSHAGALPILPVSADGTSGTRARLRQLGLLSFLHKPYTSWKLGRAVAGQLTVPVGAAAAGQPTEHKGIKNLLDMVGGDPILAAEVVDEFTQRSPEMMAELDRAAEDGDLELVRRHAHTLKGSLLTLGFERAGNAAAQLEREAKSKKQSQAKATLARLHMELVAAELTMREFSERARRA